MTNTIFHVTVATLVGAIAVFGVAIATAPSNAAPPEDFAGRIIRECTRQFWTNDALIHPHSPPFTGNYAVDDCIRKLWARNKYETHRDALNSIYQRSR